MVNYTKLAATALRLVEANGRQITLVKRSEVAETPSEPWKGPASEAVSTDGSTGKEGVEVLAAFVKSDSELAEFFGLIPGTDVLRGHEIAIVAGSAIDGHEPEAFDSVIDGDDVWSIRSVDTLRPASVSLIHVFVLSR